MAEFFCTFECLKTKNATNQGSRLYQFCQIIWERLWENSKTEGLNDFRTCSTVNFPKKKTDFGGLETIQRHEIQTYIFFHMPLYIWTQYKICFGILLGTSSNCNKFWGQNQIPTNQFLNFLDSSNYTGGY